MSAHSPMPHGESPVYDKPGPRPLPYTAGFADGFGERKLVFDPATSTSLEVLRFKKEFSDSPDFEGGLLARVEALSNIKHASLGTVQSVDRISETELELVSRHTPGRRVSELLPKAHGPAFALELIRLVTPALAALQRAGDDIVHGALSPERIVVTRDGRLVVVEYVMGSAIEALRLPRQKLNDLGLVVPAGADPIQFNSRTDITQLGFIALALLLGRRLNASDYPEKVPALLDEFSRSGSPMLAAKLRSWLERAMQISPRSFASAKEAVAAFGDLPDDADVQAAELVSSLDAFPQEAISPASAPGSPLRPAASARPESSSSSHAAPAAGRATKAPGKKRFAVWAMILFGLVAAGEGVALFVMPYLRPASEVIEVRPSAPASNIAADLRTATPSSPLATPIADPQHQAASLTTVAAAGAAVGSPAASSTSGTSAPAAASAPPVAPTPAPGVTPAPTAGPKFGGLSIASAMDLQVFENGKLIGSTAGPIALNEGPRTIEVVNETLGFRFRQTVNVKGGQMTTVNIAVPNGRISINAAPWAEVDIDGKPAGETPLANLSLPIGSHEITFRHPEHGVKKQTVVVKVEGLTRVTQVFQPEPKR